MVMTKAQKRAATATGGANNGPTGNNNAAKKQRVAAPAAPAMLTNAKKPAASTTAKGPNPTPKPQLKTPAAAKAETANTIEQQFDNGGFDCFANGGFKGYRFSSFSNGGFDVQDWFGNGGFDKSDFSRPAPKFINFYYTYNWKVANGVDQPEEEEDESCYPSSDEM